MAIATGISFTSCKTKEAAPETTLLSVEFEKEDTKALIEKYFGEIKSREEVTPLNPQPAIIPETVRLCHEDILQIRHN